MVVFVVLTVLVAQCLADLQHPMLYGVKDTVRLLPRFMAAYAQFRTDKLGPLFHEWHEGYSTEGAMAFLKEHMAVALQKDMFDGTDAVHAHLSRLAHAAAMEEHHIISLHPDEFEVISNVDFWKNIKDRIPEPTCQEDCTSSISPCNKPENKCGDGLKCEVVSCPFCHTICRECEEDTEPCPFDPCSLQENMCGKGEQCKRDPCKPGCYTICVPHPQCNVNCKAKQENDEYDPICGTDGKTYRNSCYFNNAVCQSRGTLHLAHNGRCLPVELLCEGICTKEYQPVCSNIGKTYPNECMLDYKRCLTYGYEYWAHDGPCVDPDCDLTDCAKQPMKKICGNNFFTYPNECYLEYATCASLGSVLKAYEGECMDHV